MNVSALTRAPSGSVSSSEKPTASLPPRSGWHVASDVSVAVPAPPASNAIVLPGAGNAFTVTGSSWTETYRRTTLAFP